MSQTALGVQASMLDASELDILDTINRLMNRIEELAGLARTGNVSFVNEKLPEVSELLSDVCANIKNVSPKNIPNELYVRINTALAYIKERSSNANEHARHIVDETDSILDATAQIEQMLNLDLSPLRLIEEFSVEFSEFNHLGDLDDSALVTRAARFISILRDVIEDQSKILRQTGGIVNNDTTYRLPHSPSQLAGAIAGILANELISRVNKSENHEYDSRRIAANSLKELCLKLNIQLTAEF